MHGRDLHYSWTLQGQSATTVAFFGRIPPTVAPRKAKMPLQLGFSGGLPLQLQRRIRGCLYS